MNQGISDSIKDLKITSLKESIYLKPLKVEYKINGREKFWDFLTIHDSVSILIYNTSRKVLVFVRQFRPAMYVGKIPGIADGMVIDTNKYNLLEGYSLELCAGLVDKNYTLEQIAKDEILEECGYDVPLSSLKKLFSFRNVGVTGNVQTLYYVEVTDDQKVGKGGGLKEEGEFIEVIELTIPQIKQYLEKKDILSPPAFLAAVQWFLHNVSNC